MTYSIQFVGLACFLKSPGERYVLFPDGRNPGEGVEPHFASIVVTPDAVDDAVGWDAASLDSGQFRLPPCSIRIQGTDDDGTLDTADHDNRLPQLCRIDPRFSIDRDQAETIATIDIRNGKLTGYRIPGGTAVISQLDVDHDGMIDVEVTPRDGSPVQSIRLVAGTEIALANMALRYDDDPDEENGHFQIYEKLSSTQPVSLSQPVTVNSDVPPSPSRHTIFTSRTAAGLASSCSNTGCCDP